MNMCAKCGKPVGGLLPKKNKYCTKCRAGDARPSHKLRKEKRRMLNVLAATRWLAHHKFEVRWGKEYEFDGAQRRWVEGPADRCDGSIRRGLVEPWVRFSIGRRTQRAQIWGRLEITVSHYIYWYDRCMNERKNTRKFGNRCLCTLCQYRMALNKPYGGRPPSKYVHSVQKEHKWQRELRDQEEAIQQVLPQVEVGE